jgi:Xaa-Pro aminopeptidase
MTSDYHQERFIEVQEKLTWVRSQLASLGVRGVRLRGTDWFAWITAGGSNMVLLAAEIGVAEVLITESDAIVLTDEIEAVRLQDEEVSAGFSWHAAPWAELQQRETFVTEATAGGLVLSDRPQVGEHLLPSEFLRRRLCLSASEHDRYRDVGQRAALAMSEVMHAARPNWTEYELAGAGAEALWSHGLHPALTLAAGEARLPRYRHPTPSAARLGSEAMLVFCARGFGLYANLTRFVRFSPANAEQNNRHEIIRTIEAAALQACRPGLKVSHLYETLAQAYSTQGYPAAIREHHQGGLTGYRAREIIATPDANVQLETGMAIALNPSLPGVKIEDTFLVHADEVENLTLDPDWPSTNHDERLRPLPLERP